MEKETNFRREVRAWLESNVPSERLPTFDRPEGFEAHRAWEKKLNAGGYAMVSWPREFGGLGVNLLEWLIFEEEYWRAEAPLRVNQNGIFLLGPTLMEYGTDEQKARFLPQMAASEDIWAQAWSEPGAGSDMAAIRSTGRIEGDDRDLFTRAPVVQRLSSKYEGARLQRSLGFEILLFCAAL